MQLYRWRLVENSDTISGGPERNAKFLANGLTELDYILFIYRGNGPK
jgi:hypothetical protein